MISSLIGGTLVALACLLISILKRSAQRKPKPFWSRSEVVESLVAVTLVCMIAHGFAMLVSSIGSGGWIALIVAGAIAVFGSAAAFVFDGRRARPQPA